MPPKRRRSPRRKIIEQKAEAVVPNDQSDHEEEEEEQQLQQEPDLGRKRARTATEEQIPPVDDTFNAGINDTKNEIPESEDLKPAGENVTANDQDATVDQISSPDRSSLRSILDRTSPLKNSKFTEKFTIRTPSKKPALPVAGRFTTSSASATPTRPGPPEFKLPSDSVVSQLFHKRDMKTLTSLLHDISNNKTEKLFQEYKKTSERRQNAADALVTSLTKENVILKTNLKSLKQEKQSSKEMENLKREVEQMKKEKAKLIEENNSLREKVTGSLANIEDAANGIDLCNTKLEILELLTRASCFDFNEDEENLEFSMKQVGETGTLLYKLVISKTGVSELVYMPLLSTPNDFEGDWAENVETLQQILPDYLLDNLTFPSSTLSNFYTKLARSLNKKME